MPYRGDTSQEVEGAGETQARAFIVVSAGRKWAGRMSRLTIGQYE